MGAFGQGFATGFFNKLSEGIDTRNADARDYFNKQVETARTLGLENRRRSSAMIDESVGVAKRLQAMGVPKDIIMAQANMDPAGLGDFYTQVEKLRLEANVPVDEEFFRSIYKLSGTFKAPDEDFNTFFSKIYGPIVQAAQEDPEGFKQDPEGSIWARAFGGGAMDRARDKLATTEVVPGMTAEQAIAQGDTPRPNKVGGDSVVTVEPNALKAATDKPKTLSPTDMSTIQKMFEEQFESVRTELTTLEDENGNRKYNTDENPEALENLNIASRAAAYKAIEEQFAGNEDYLSYIRSVYRLDEEGMPVDMDAPTEPTGGATEPPPEETLTPAPEANDAVEPPPRPVTGKVRGPDEELTEEEKKTASFADQYSTPTTFQTTIDGQGVSTWRYVKKQPNGMLVYENTEDGKQVADWPENFARWAE